MACAWRSSPTPTWRPAGAAGCPIAASELIAGSDLLVHAGDIMTLEALAEIEAIGPPVRAMTGNMDGWELRDRLPGRTRSKLAGATLAVVHDAGPAAGRLERMRRRFPDADAVVFGHSHIPLHEREGDFQIFNPGSPTERRRAPHHSMGLARVEDGRIEFELVELWYSGRYARAGCPLRCRRRTPRPQQKRGSGDAEASLRSADGPPAEGPTAASRVVDKATAKFDQMA